MIERFTGKYAFLSNFHYCTVEALGTTFPTLEHAYQASKCMLVRDIEYIRNLNTPGKAKRAGQSVKCMTNWDAVKVDIMHDLLHQKFRDQKLKAQLLDTDDEYLQEGNSWNDTFWGRVRVGSRWVGENRLGKLLMEVREELREE